MIILEFILKKQVESFLGKLTPLAFPSEMHTIVGAKNTCLVEKLLTDLQLSLAVVSGVLSPPVALLW